uniref:Uncharacterized protein n=1 Tax=Glossina pallidipes TaxID=7398 RepID=A0A1B0AE41_GLOPL
MFATDMKEREEGTVKLQNLDAISEKAPVNYVYNAINAPTENNVEEVLHL